VGLDPTVTNIRVFPLLEIGRAELAEMVGGHIARIELAEGGLTNTIHKVMLENGDVLGIKHYAGGREWFDTELMTLTLLHGTVPVPAVVHADERRLAIVYRWIDGITLHELRKQGETEAFATLAEPLGRCLAWLAKTDATESFELTEVLERAYAQLSTGRARERLGEENADALRRALEAYEPTMAWGAVCLSHGDLGHRNVIVARSGGRWRVNGLIDWETTTTSSPLADIGSLFRYANRADERWRSDFARGYAEAAANPLPDQWLHAARLIDATELVAVLDQPDDAPEMISDVRRLVLRLVDELSRSR
jgi:aminoglycoside phosphotransferase (APT) family kinase protein